MMVSSCTKPSMASMASGNPSALVAIRIRLDVLKVVAYAVHDNAVRLIAFESLWVDQHPHAARIVLLQLRRVDTADGSQPNHDDVVDLAHLHIRLCCTALMPLL